MATDISRLKEMKNKLDIKKSRDSNLISNQESLK